MLWVVLQCVLCERRRCNLPASVRRASVLGFTRSSTSTDDDNLNYETVTPATAATYEEIRTSRGFGSEYEQLTASTTRQSLSSPVINAPRYVSSVYSDTTTTLVENALYDVQQPPVTSSNVAETGDDVTDLTVIDNDLYEREGQGQQNSGFIDYECSQYTGWQWSVSSQFDVVTLTRS